MKHEVKDRVEEVVLASSAVIGAAGGAVAAGSIAAATGATGIPVITTLASWFGVTLVAATPIGWIIGSACLGGTLFYGAAKVVSNVSRHRGRREILESLKMEETNRQQRKQNIEEVEKADLGRLKGLIDKAICRGIIDDKHGERLINVVRKGNLQLDKAEAELKRLLEPGFRAYT